MTQMRLDYDISRGYKNPQSQKAHEAIAPAKPTLRREVERLISEAGISGMTLYELAEKLHKPVHSLSGRITELAIDKLIADSGRTRKSPGGHDCAVYVSALLLSKTLEPKETKVKVVVAGFSAKPDREPFESTAPGKEVEQ